MPLVSTLASDLTARFTEVSTNALRMLPEPVAHKLTDDWGVTPTLLTALAATSAAAAATLYVRSQRSNNPTTKAGTNKSGNGQAPPHVKHWIPFFGSMVAYGMDPLAFLARHRAELGDVFTFTMFGREMTYALGPDGNNAVFNVKLSHASAEKAYNSLTKPIFGPGVVYDTENHIFMDQKKIGKTGMSIENLRAYVPMIEDETRNYFARWDRMHGGQQELFKALAELVIMTASRCLMGPEIRSKLDESVAGLYHDLDQGFQPINFLFEWLPLPSYARRDVAHAKMRDLFMSIIAKRQAEEPKREYTDVLQTYMTATYKNGTPFSPEEAAYMMIALLMAGQHTSSTTSTWALAYLADRPDVWAQVEAELRRELGADLKGTLDYDTLKRCVLLDAIVKETLRLRSPIHAIMRKVEQPLEIGGYLVPVGHYLCASPSVSQVDPVAYPNPEQWEPSRWVETKSGTKPDDEGPGEDFGFGAVSGSARSNYLPFGAGRHRCIGEPFAFVQIKTILATFVREFASVRFDAPHVFPKRDYTSMVVMPERPVMLSYERRVPPSMTTA
ncbi:cytochrome P450 [Blastocladiella britannica]|nr:cytochrome P450 [Blastocladiella britannica]